MKIESEQKVGASKEEHSSERKNHFSGYLPRRFDTRWGMIYLVILKIRKGGYIPFFTTEKRRISAPPMYLNKLTGRLGGVLKSSPFFHQESHILG
ncbi:MAG: hypothetical protein GWP03_06245 [Proteobacteria bacterium]|nr:hypothetical protein [Pseudomonadota bacterium]